MKINIHNLLLKNRQQSVAEGYTDKEERIAIQLWLRTMKSRRLLNLLPAKAKNLGADADAEPGRLEQAPRRAGSSAQVV